jgi:glycosyl transferase family 2
LIMASELISILICTFNRSHCLDELLARLTTMFAGESLEILVFDDASSDDTAIVCAKYTGKIRCIRSAQNVGYIAGRARLIEEARGEYLAFLDDDSCFVDRHAVRYIRETFLATADCGVIACNIASPSEAGGQVPQDSVRVEVAQFIGCGHVLRAEAARKVGSYPSFLSGYGAEETLLALRMLDAGYRIILIPYLRVYHAEEPSQRPIIQRRAACLLNELAIVISCYPLWLVVPGIGKKLLSHVVFNLKDNSSAALKLAAKLLPSVFRKALAARQPIRTGTLWHWYRVREEFVSASAGWKDAGNQPRWNEIGSMFAEQPRSGSQSSTDVTRGLW